MTTIAAKKVVSLEYVLKNDAGEEIDRSEPGKPMLYLHGARNIVPGLEKALEGKSAGDEVDAVVPPEQGYGVRQKVKPITVMRSKLPPELDVQKGAQLVMQGPQGNFPVWVAKVMGSRVQLTPLHPLTGETLHFSVKVVEIRDASEEELAHGHVHGPGGHHHEEE